MQYDLAVNLVVVKVISLNNLHDVVDVINSVNANVNANVNTNTIITAIN